MKRALRALCTASIVTLLILPSTRALADDPPAAHSPGPAKAGAGSKPTANEIAPEKTETKEPSASIEQMAAAAYQRAIAAYEKGDVKGAFESMRESYQLSRRPELLYNLASLEDELKQCQASLEDYQNYLDLVPNGRYRGAALQASENLGRACPAAQSPASPSPSAAAGLTPAAQHARIDDEQKQSGARPEASYWTTPHVLAWSAIATGALAGAGAVYFAFAEHDARNDFQRSVDGAERTNTGADYSLQDRQHRDKTIAIALAATGGALVAGGALILVLEPGKRAKNRASARLYVEPGLLGACYSQAF